MDTQSSPYALVPPVGRQVVSVGASPFSIQNTNAADTDILIRGGTVTTIEFSKDGVTWDVVGVLGGLWILRPSEWMKITYIIAPQILML